MRFQRIAIALIVVLYGFVISLSPAHAQEKCAATYGSGMNKLSLATGSPGELGLLKVLGETFGKESDTARRRPASLHRATGISLQKIS